MSRRPGNSAKPSTTLLSKRKRADSAVPNPKHPTNAQASAQAQRILRNAAHTFAQPGLPASVMQPVAGSSIRRSSSAQLNSARLPGGRTLKSAFRLPPPAFQWSREVSVADYRFTHSTAQYQPNGDVRITRSSESLDVIAIAEDWLNGEEMWEKKEQHHKTGFIGRGFTKRGVYVCSFSKT